MHTCNCLCHLAPPIRSSHPYTTYTVVDVCVYVRQCGFCMSPPVLLNRIKSEIGVHVNPTTQPFSLSLSLSLSLLHTHADPNTERQSILHNVKSIDEHKSVSSLSLSLSLSLSTFIGAMSSPLRTDRESSSIPRGDAAPAHQPSGSAASRTWTYPSPRQFYDALRKKGFQPDERDMDAYVSLSLCVHICHVDMRSSVNRIYVVFCV